MAGNKCPLIVKVKASTRARAVFPPTDRNPDADVAHPCWWCPKGPSGHTVREMKLLYLWMFLLRISEHGPSTRSKRGLSSFTHLSGPRATTVAALGRFNSRAISPGGEGEAASWLSLSVCESFQFQDRRCTPLYYSFLKVCFWKILFFSC